MDWDCSSYCGGGNHHCGCSNFDACSKLGVKLITSVVNVSQTHFKQFDPSKLFHAFISIKDSSDSFSVTEEEKQKWLDGLSLVFDDVDSEQETQQIISKEQCQEIINFTNKIHDLPHQVNLVIHCFAGISRSAAVGKWVNDAYNLSLPFYQNNSMIYNHKVYFLLNKTFYGLDW